MSTTPMTARLRGYGMRVALACLACTWLSISLPSRAAAQELNQEFLEALLENRYFDVALEFLEAEEAAGDANEEFVERIPLFRVDVLLAEANTLRDADRITAKLDQTQAILDAFIDSQPDAELLAQAQEQRANIAMARARRLLDRASSDRATAADQQAYRDQARAFLTEASAAFESIRQRLRSEIENYQVDPQDPNSVTRLERLKDEYVKIRIKSPRVKEQTADSFAPGSPDAKKLYSEAADEFVDLFEKYRTRLSGVDGCLGAARCFHKAGDDNRSMGYLLEVFSLPPGQIQNQKKREAAIIALEIWADQDPYPAQDAFMRLQPLIYTMPPDFGRSSDGLMLRIEFAKICHRLAEMIRENGPENADERKQMNQLDRESVNIVRSLSRVANPYREEARQLLADWGERVAALDGDDDPENAPPTTLADARQRGIDLQMQVAELSTVRDVRAAELESAEGAEAAEIQSELDSLRERIETVSRQALAMFDLALGFANEETTADDLSGIRHRQCISYLQMQRPFETAIIGEFLIDRFPDNAGTRQSAGMVCTSYWDMYVNASEASESEADSGAFEASQLKKYCDLVIERWPGSEESRTAAMIMMQLALSQQQPMEAERYLQMLPEDSSGRTTALLSIGIQLWQKYVRGQKAGTPDPSLRDQAKATLEPGVAGLKPEGLTPFQARAALALTELYLDEGAADAAIQQLELATVAPLDLIKTKHPVTTDANYRRDTFRTAIRAYLAKLRDGEDAIQWVDKANGVLAALKTELESQPGGKEKLTGIYLVLSRQLKEQFDSLDNSEQREVFATSLESFISSLAAQAEDRQLVMLAGQMLMDIGNSLRDEGQETIARRFFEKASTLYGDLSKSTDPDPRLQLAIERGRANALLGTGDYEQAVKLYGDILENPENRKYLDLQVDAATALAEWGIADRDAEALVGAVQGGEKRDGKATIMGWTQIAKIARRQRDNALFAEAIWNIARCKHLYGTIRNQASLRESAISELKNFQKNVPDMGGPRWKSRIESLLNELSSKN